MKKINNTIIFTIITLFLLIIPCIKWIKYIDVTNNGLDISFKITGYDPVDVLKGNYVRMSYDYDDYMIYAYLENDSKKGYVYISYDEEGNIEEVSFDKPRTKYYIKGEVRYSLNYDIENEIVYGTPGSDKLVYKIRINWPTKYYTNEENAKRIEDDLNNWDEEVKYEVFIKVKNNVMIIKDLRKIY